MLKVCLMIVGFTAYMVLAQYCFDVQGADALICGLLGGILSLKLCEGGS